MQLEINEDAEQQLRDLEASINALDDGLKKQIYGEMSYGAASYIAKDLKSTPRFVDRTGLLRKSIRAKRRDDRDITGKVIKNGAAAATVGAPHGHLIEHGTDDRTQSSTGRRTGRVDARRFFRDSLDANTNKAIDKGLEKAKKKFDKWVDGAKKGTMTKATASQLAR